MYMSLVITIVTVHLILLQITMLHSLDWLPALTFQISQIQQRYALAGSYLNIAILYRFGQRTGCHLSSSQVLDHCSNPINKQSFPYYFRAHLPPLHFLPISILFNQFKYFSVGAFCIQSTLLSAMETLFFVARYLQLWCSFYCTID